MSNGAPIRIGLLPCVLLIGVFVCITYRMERKSGGGGIFGFGKSKAKKYQKGPSDVTFVDVAGLENAKRDLREIIEYLRNPQRYQKIGAKLSPGILLMGPPGTGKTLLAKAVAGEADAPYFSISGSEFVEVFVGVGVSRVRDMFATAKKEAPTVIFIDEIDSVGRSRGTGFEQKVGQILSEHRNELETVAQELVENEILEAADLRRLLDSHGLRIAGKQTRTA